MGKLERLVVLVVFFLAAVVLAVSLSDDAVDEGANPFDKAADATQQEQAQVRTAAMPVAPETSAHRRGTSPVVERRDEAPAQAAPEARTEDPVATGTAPATPNLLLDAGSKPEARTPSEPAGPRQILKSTAGLRASMSEAYREYEVRAGDTWTGLAQRFYKDTRRVGDLKVANEDLKTLTPGQRILVPVYDLTQEANSRPRLVAVERPGTRPAVEPIERSQPAPREVAAPAAPIAAGTIYTVVDGDNLSKISQKVYGTQSRWRAIYEANRDTMKSADWLQVGMKLRIPTVEEAASAPARPAEKPVDPDRPRVH
ncbi:MAG TPA: LysM peptidoglycan-binding domain-containing protein [Planctomycetes bacterium]|nr:LysM peptidoglycan-binding domain-containing protein [Planctomycetota bacterium]